MSVEDIKEQQLCSLAVSLHPWCYCLLVIDGCFLAAKIQWWSDSERPKDDRFCHLSYDSWVAKYVMSSKVLLDLVVICGEPTDYL
jgi:hypothetical protein